MVLYGDNTNWFAAWALWILKYYGHQDVRLLDGGRVKWLADKRPITTEIPSYSRTVYLTQSPDTQIRALRDLVLAEIGQKEVALVDVRSPGEYSGELLAPAHLPQEGAQRGVIFREQLIYPGHWQLTTMEHLNRLMSYVPCMKTRVLQKIKR